MKVAYARVQQQPGNLQPEALRDAFIIALHWKTKSGKFCDNSVRVLESYASGRLPLSHPAEKRLADRLRAAVKVETPVFLIHLRSSRGCVDKLFVARIVSLRITLRPRCHLLS